MKNLKLVIGAQLMLTVLAMLAILFQTVAAGNQQQDIQVLKDDNRSQRVLDDLVGAMFDEWASESRNKKSKERSFRQMKPTLRFGRRSDPSFAPLESPSPELGDRDRYEIYNL